MFRFNIPVTKVDEEKRLVYGLVTEEIVDQSGEVLDYESSKAYFTEWSDGISKATGGASLGNLRLMHQPIIAGKIVELTFDDALKQIACVAKIVSDDVWKLVLEGCLTGFSMGGKYVKRWKDAVDKSITRFTAKPVEVSVVDNPCVSTATFEYIKANGSIELRKFHAGDGTQEEDNMFTQEQIAAKAAELAKAAGTPEATDQFLDEALVVLQGEDEAEKAAKPPVEDETGETDDKKKKDGEDEATDEDAAKKAADDEANRLAAAGQLVQVWQAPDGTTHAKKAAAVDHVIANPVAFVGPEETEVEKAIRVAREGAVEAPPAGDGPLDVLEARLDSVHKGLLATQEALPEVAKGMYTVTELASTISSFRYIVSCSLGQQREDGAGTIGTKLMEALTTMGEVLVEMAQAEVARMMGELGDEWPTELLVVELAALVEMTKANTALVEKVGARNSSADQSRIQVTHDNAVLLGATCECDTTKAVIADEQLEETDLVKTLRAENNTLSEEVTKAVSGITELGDLVKTLRTDLDTLKAIPKPLPPRTDHVVVERFGKTTQVGVAEIEKMSPDERADLAIRLSQMAPVKS